LQFGRKEGNITTVQGDDYSLKGVSYGKMCPKRI